MGFNCWRIKDLEFSQWLISEEKIGTGLKRMRLLYFLFFYFALAKC